MNFAFGKSAILPTCPSHNAFCAAITFQHTNFSANDAISLPAVIRTVSFQVSSLLDNSGILQGENRKEMRRPKAVFAEGKNSEASGIDSLQATYDAEVEKLIRVHICYPPISNQSVNGHLA